MPTRPTEPGNANPDAEDDHGSERIYEKATASVEPLRDADDDGYEMAEMSKDGKRVDEECGDVQQAMAGAEEQDSEHEDDRAPLAGTGRRRRRSSLQSFQLYTPDEEAKVRHKLDTRLVLFVALLYMMAFLDRSNIGASSLSVHFSITREDAVLTSEQVMPKPLASPLIFGSPMHNFNGS